MPKGADVLLGRCEVMIGRSDTPVVTCDVKSAHLPDGVEVNFPLEFALDQLEFGMQFRCIVFGHARFRCKLDVNLRAA